jgi:sucrose-phosphate synthase
MLIGQTAGIVVGNYDEELSELRQPSAHRLYFAQAHCAGGIIEGLQHYGFLPPLDAGPQPVSSEVGAVSSQS